MTEIEKKALALLNDAFREPYYEDWSQVPQGYLSEGLCRAIERHEAFRQEVSDAVLEYYGGYRNAMSEPLSQFIITKPDPLVETLKDMRSDPTPYINSEIYAKRLREALAKRGLEIVEKSDD